MTFLTYFFILLVLILLSFFGFSILKLYLNYKKEVQNKSHYPISLAITLLLIPLITGISSIDIYPILLANKFFNLNLPLPDNSSKIIFYLLYISAVIVIIFIYYKFQNNKEFKKEKILHSTIKYPSTEIISSPFLHERIKELFELKYEKQDLKLLYDEQEQILIGEYSDAIHKYRYLIYCNSSSEFVSKNKQNEILDRLKDIQQNKSNLDNKNIYEAKYFYFILNGIFENNENNELKCFDENSFLNIVIDFSSYLKKNVQLFDEQLSDIGRILFKESFIPPKFNRGQKNLEVYLDNWLSEKSYKHISLLADYGMGKTTFLKYYTSYLSKKILAGENFSRYPVFISLTNTSPMSNDGIQTKIQSFVSNELGVNYSLFEKLIHLGKIVFILDGFDEMGFIGTEKTRFEQFNSIWQLATKDNKILISGRPSYLPTEFERKNVLNIVEKELHVSQQNPYTEIIEFDYFQEEEILKTLKAYYKDSKIIEQYFRYIKSNKSVLDLCKRPSMLHMTMSIIPNLYEEGLSKKISASSLMNKYIEFWISRQESKNIKGFFNKNNHTKKAFLIDFFTNLASLMYEDKTLVISKRKLDSLITKEIENLNMDIQNRDEILEGFKNEIYSGYFIEVDINYSKEDNFRFVHKSIFEFFVSKKIMNLISEKNFKHNLWSLNWDKEIIDFIYSEIDLDKNSKYPALITLRNSIFDKYILIFITNLKKYEVLIFFLVTYPILLISSFILENKQTSTVKKIDENIFLVIIIVLLIFFIFKKLINFLISRFSFISKAYYIEIFKNNYSITNRKLQHFFDFYKLFKTLNNMTFKDYKFINNSFYNISFKDTILEKVTFEKCNFNKTYFDNSELKNVIFNNSNIKYLKFDNCTFYNVNLKNVKFKRNSNILSLMVEKILSTIFMLKSEKKYFFYRKAISRIIFSNTKVDNFDENSINSFKEVIKSNNLKRKNILCDKELKDILFKTNNI
ncbi:pentapeptide repeat-containing protein [Aliarcobacter butzleri]|uniref:Pentapeptide repeat-containing protein n=2 Tax=Aliarcobacter butzleri TaxID=28197 RepID=A0AAW6VCP7_9BACT|nr:pentapeptide repeat-containing protein [Aliarcobacter butzleri]MDK2040287.1 pentapeptide repeat-containing protein [Aliarcobacter butzleri]MDK2097481.1 pentapeptide repeat-containing protein [Aliarcobacter butzleri]